MRLEEWVDFVRNAVGPAEFRSIALEFLREHYRGATVILADGTGDGGVDAWVVLSSEPRVRLAAQLHAGKAKPWDLKLREDARALRDLRERLDPDDPRRLDHGRLLFVCTQTPSAIKKEELNAALQRDYGVSVEVFDARAIASEAVHGRGRVLDLLARQIPAVGEVGARPLPNARDEVLLAFAFFHEQPAKYRWEVAKSAIATVLHRHRGGLPRSELLSAAAELLRLSSDRLLQRALRNLEREGKVVVDGERVAASTAFAERTRTALTIAAADEEALRRRCEADLAPLLAKGVHHRSERARRAVDAVFGDLGLLVRDSVSERALGAVDRDPSRLGKADDEARRRWQALAHKLASELELDHAALEAAFGALVRAVADSPFARNLAAAELFMRITEYDADELARVLEMTSPLRVVLDASVAMPMICALFDRPSPAWETSIAAHSLYASLRARGARMSVPSVYIEEIAAHLIKARAFETIIETESELERSRNFFVAHYSSTRREGERRAAEFREFLTAFGAPHPFAGQVQLKERRRVEYTIGEILRRYEIEVDEVLVHTDDPALVDEPAREGVLIRHDRAVVRWLTTHPQREAVSVLSTADRWLQGVLGEFGVIAVDSAALADLLELVRPVGVDHGLLTPLVIAQSLNEESRVLAASVWDELVALEGARLADWKLLQRARAFRTQWLAGRRELASLAKEWAAFRDAES